MSTKQHWKLHTHRRRTILKQHPQIRRLFGVDWRTQFYAYICVALQLLFIRISNASLLNALLFGVTIGPYIDAGLLCFLHEATHMLIFRRSMFNRLIAIFANLPLLIPISEVHRQHHARHHGALGEVSADVDVPSDLEVSLVGNHPLRKAIWLTFNMILLPARSMCRLPVTVDTYLILNWLSCFLVAFSILLYSRTSFLYVVLSVLNSQGLHPANARQVQRHVFNGSERMRSKEHMPTTYSYYGTLNYLMLNVGYHVEHHDFPRIPWTKLPELRRVVGEEWYPAEHAYNSRGLTNIFNFVMNPNISLSDFAH
ncbi:unnamed protein product [Agarophyton chilense]